MDNTKIFLLALMFVIYPFVPEIKSEETVNKSVNKKLTSYILLNTKEITPKGKLYRRPDAVLVRDHIYLTFANESGFLLARVSENLDVSVLGELANPADEFAADVRLAPDGGNVWYAMETFLNQTSPECGKNFLNIGKYSLGKEEIKRIANYSHITSGCPTIPSFIPSLLHSPLLPSDAKAVDDPTPILIDGHYFVMARGWISKQKQYIYKMDKAFKLIETIELDLSSHIKNDFLSQNVLINIDGQIYLIAGIGSGPPRGNNYSQIKAFPLSRDLKTVNGKIITFFPTNENFFTRVTAASYYKGRLFFNFIERAKNGREDKGYIAVFNAEKKFQPENHILFQKQSAAYNHSTFVIVNDKIFIFYEAPNKTIMAKVFAIKSPSGE